MKRLPVLALLLGLLGLAILGLVLYWQRTWIGSERFTVISLENPITVETFDPVTRVGLRLVLPDNLQIISVGGRGVWPAKSITQAGKAVWVADSVADFLGISYTAVKQHLGGWDFIQWWWYSSQMTWDEVDLSQTGLVSPSQAADGVKVLTLSPLWYGQAQTWFASQSVSVGGWSVRIINTTAAAGLGAHAARVVESMGIKVVEITTSEEKMQDCVVASPKEAKSLLAYFDCQWEQSSDATLVLKLGQKYAAWALGD